MVLYRFVTFEFRGVLVICDEYVVVKETPKGYWIADWSTKNGQRWVSKSGFKRFAYASKADAADNYIARTRRYLTILRARTELTEISLKWFEENKNDLVNGRPPKLLEYPVQTLLL